MEGSLEERKLYKSLKKSSVTPPGYVFGIAWTILYVILAIYFILGINLKKTNKAMIYFVAQMLINISWTYVFFGKSYRKLALFLIIVMIILTILSMLEMLKVNRYVAFLLIPYLLWLLFATYLSGYIVFNN